MSKKQDKPFISNAKYESTGETKVVFGVTLHRIRAKVAIGLVAAGALHIYAPDQLVRTRAEGE